MFLILLNGLVPICRVVIDYGRNREDDLSAVMGLNHAKRFCVMIVSPKGESVTVVY